MKMKRKSKTCGAAKSRDPGAGSRSAAYDKPEHLGRFLIASAPRGFDLELPSRGGDRGDPFASDEHDGK
jgi:hypothetical protein